MDWIDLLKPVADDRATKLEIGSAATRRLRSLCVLQKIKPVLSFQKSKAEMKDVKFAPRFGERGLGKFAIHV